MKTLNSIACAGGIAVAAMLTSSLAAAETVEQTTAQDRNSGSKVHQVSHALASTSSYQGSSNAGYKWGRDSSDSQAQSQGKWRQTTVQQSGNKWSSPAATVDSSARSFASSTGNRWGLRSFSEQTGNRWGLRSFSEQTGNRWGLRSFSEQTGNRWGLRSFSEQTGNRWGLRSFSEQTGNRWGLRNFSEQAGNRWGLRNFSEQAGNRWGLRNFSEQAGNRWGLR